MLRQKLKKNMDADIINDFLGGPIRSLEIDNSVPAYHLEDYQMDQRVAVSHSLDVSFGGRKVVVDVKHEKWNK